MNKWTLIIAACLLGWYSFRPTFMKLSPEQPVAALLETLGDSMLPHKPRTTEFNVSVERGRDIVIKGFSSEFGKNSRRQSKYFTCISCHSIVKEDPDLAHPDPHTRLEYVTANGMPFLPGSALYGIVNRTSFYNGDYVKKYGPLVEPTRNNLREAIQLCAIECSQGRKLRDFEIESVLAYLWTLELKLSDLNFSMDEMKQLENAYDRGEKKEEAIQLIKSKYLEYSPATFVNPPSDRKTGDGVIGNPNAGAKIYKASCQYCHFDNRYSFLLLDNSKQTFQYLLQKAGTYQPHSIYQVIRYGTSPKGGKEAYMPLYTREKMTDQQIADLRAYIEVEASKGKMSKTEPEKEPVQSQ